MAETPLTPIPSRVLSHKVIRDGAPWATKCIAPEMSPSFMTAGPPTLIQLTFNESTPAALACFSIRPPCSISIIGRKLTPNCCATVISATSAWAGEAAAIIRAPRQTNLFMSEHAPGRVIDEMHAHALARAGIGVDAPAHLDAVDGEKDQGLHPQRLGHLDHGIDMADVLAAVGLGIGQMLRAQPQGQTLASRMRPVARHAGF